MKLTLYILIILTLIIWANIFKTWHEYQALKVIKPVIPKYKLLGYSSTKEQVKEAVIEQFGHKMAKIVECESSFNLHAKNFNTNNTVDKGLFQINSVHKKEAEKLGIDLRTIEGQFQFAKVLVKRNGYKDWVCYRKLGMVK